MRRYFAAAFIVMIALSGQLLGQEEENRKLTMTERMRLQSLKWQLKLSDTQVDKVRELLIKEGDRTRSAMLDLLDEDQREAFEEMEKRNSSSGPFGEVSKAFDMAQDLAGGPFGITVKGLKKEIDLTEDEEKELAAIIKDYRERRAEAASNSMEGFDFGKIQDMVKADRELGEKTLKKMRRALDSEKRDRFDRYVEKRKKNHHGFPGDVRVIGPGGKGMEGLKGLGDLGKTLKDKLGELGKQIDKLKKGDLDHDPIARLDGICKKAGFEGVEGDILRDKVKAVLDAKADFARFMASQKPALMSISEEADEAAAQEKLKLFREERNAHHDRLKALREDLRSLLTHTQEANLIAQGVLE